MTKIQVFLRSIVLPSQLISLHYSYDYHYYLENHFRGSYHWLRDQGFSKGRIFEPDSAALLPILDKAMIAFGYAVRVYDLNSLRGKFSGWRYGIWRAPSILIDREKYHSLEPAREALTKELDLWLPDKNF